MLKYRESNLIKAGFIGVVLMMLIIAVGLQPERLQQWASSVRHQALFSEAGGIATGNDVTLSGIKIGSVTEVALQNGDALVTFTTEGKYPLGSLTTAHIRTGSLLGRRRGRQRRAVLDSVLERWPRQPRHSRCGSLQPSESRFTRISSPEQG